MNVFHTPETTMTPEEAEAIVRRHLERVPEMPSGPSVADVAEVLRLRPDEVAALLAEVRSDAIRKPKRKITKRERRVWLLSGGVAIAVGALVITGLSISRLGPFRRHNSLRYNRGIGEPFHVFVDNKDLGEIRFDGSGMETQVLPSEAEMLLKDQSWQLARTPAQSDNIIDETRRAVRDGQWDRAPGIRMASVEIRKGSYGNAMRWARTSAPVYTGDDSLVAEAVIKERERRLSDAVNEAMKGILVPASNPKP